MFNPDGCSHGVRWEDKCNHCDALTIRQEIYDLSVDCKHVAEQLERQPVMCSSPETIIDLYRTIDRLSLILLKLRIE